jgi:uncharacterized protein (TIGR02118 family)
LLADLNVDGHAATLFKWRKGGLEIGMAVVNRAVALVLYPHPEDVDAFERHYHAVHAPLVKKIPGLRSLSISRDLPVSSGHAHYYLAIELGFESLADLQAAFKSPESQAATDDLANFAPAGRVRFSYERRTLLAGQ